MPWLEVHDGTRWLYFDPMTGNQGLPDNFLLWWTGDDQLLEVDGGSDVEIRFAVQRNVMSRIELAQRRADDGDSILNQFSLFSLPIQTQAVYSVLLLIPIGAFVVVLLRNVIGLQTFGTFMPVLIALAFRETQLWWGAVLFSTLVIAGPGVSLLSRAPAAAAGAAPQRGADHRRDPDAGRCRSSCTVSASIPACQWRCSRWSYWQ